MILSVWWMGIIEGTDVSRTYGHGCFFFDHIFLESITGWDFDLKVELGWIW